MVEINAGSTLGTDIDTSELQDGSVTTVKIAAGAVTLAKIDKGLFAVLL